MVVGCERSDTVHHCKTGNFSYGFLVILEQVLRDKCIHFLGFFLFLFFIANSFMRQPVASECLKRMKSYYVFHYLHVTPTIHSVCSFTVCYVYVRSLYVMEIANIVCML